MTGIDPASQLAAIIRQQLTARRTDTHSRNIAAGDKVGTASVRPKQRKLYELIAQRVRAVDPDDPKRNSKAFRIFLESVLLNELGDELINDPAFFRLVEDVQRTMESDGELQPAIEQAGQLLLQSKNPR